MEGRTPPSVHLFLFHATLTALEKKEGGVRPIAVGCPLRHLVAKIAGNLVCSKMAVLLLPRQLGFGIRGGVEAVVHAARQYIDNLQANHAIIKLDFRNAFKSVYRDKMLDAVNDLAPDIYPFVHSIYSTPSDLTWGDKSLLSAEGVQQGDPLGPSSFVSLFIGTVVSYSPG